MTTANSNHPFQKSLCGFETLAGARSSTTGERRSLLNHRGAAALDHRGYGQTMTPEEMLAYCLAKPGAWPDNPWGHEHPVVKVHDKIFAFVGSDRRWGEERADSRGG